jgi:N-acetylmuramoyl-L-alanine amidase
MLKKTFFTLSCFFIALAILSFTDKEKPKAVRTIIIDPGHGGRDQGAKGLISTEAQLCLAISKKLGPRIEKEIPGVKIQFTRTTDIIPGNSRDKNEGLRYRADFANNSRADLFVSIHCNSAGRAPGGWYEKKVVGYNEKVSYKTVKKKKKKVVTKVPVYESYYVTNQAVGTETFIWTARENSHKEQMVGTHAELSGEMDSSIVVPENDPVINALKLVYTKKYFLNSLRLADFVQTEFEKSGRVNRGVKQRNDVGIWVLHATGMPSILVEAGFISNKEEEEYLNSEAGQEEIVNNITDAVKNYIALQESGSPNRSGDAPVSGSPMALAGEAILNEKKKNGMLL